VAAMTIVLYAYFLQRQMGPQRADFQEPGASSDPELPAAAASSAAITDDRHGRHEHRLRGGVRAAVADQSRKGEGRGRQHVLISAVMLGPGEHASIARDSVMAVSMIILDLVIGLLRRRRPGSRR
jgi:Ca2+/H+ antiporter